MRQELKKIKNLFLRQSYLDALTDYETSLSKKNFPKWDYVILTASNDEQAKAYRSQIDYRIENGFLPEQTKYVVLPDPMGKRVGSGGASLHAIRYIVEDSQDRQTDFFSNKRILVIHSGGDSKRIPQYSACGKLFSPVPRELPNGKPSTLFDEFIISMSGMPSRMKEGMMTLSGDVLLLFNALQIDYQFTGAAAISIKENVMTGKDHGVFLNDGSGTVNAFLHKLSVEQLTKAGAVNEDGDVDIDTGAIVFDSFVLDRLFSLISKNGKIDEEKYNFFVNEKARISFYGDFLYPLGKQSTLADYLDEAPEGKMCGELLSCRKRIWEALSDVNMSLISLAPAEFIHFGTTHELLELVVDQIGDYEFLDWKAQVSTNVYSEENTETARFAVNNSLIMESEIAAGCYVENSYVYHAKVNENSIISQIEIKGLTIPANVVLHGIKLGNGSFLARIYGIMDNPKGTLLEEVEFLGTKLSVMCENYHLRDVLWDKEKSTYLWNARLYPAEESWENACKSALLLYRMSRLEATAKEVDDWKAKERYSLESSFIAADVVNIINWNHELENQILIKRYLTAIANGANAIEAGRIFGKAGINKERMERLLNEAETEDFSTKIRVYYNMSKYQGETVLDSSVINRESITSEVLEERCFAEIRNTISEFARKSIIYNENRKIKKDVVTVRLPVRVNWGGGWTDTPPHCMEKGGVVLNAAITLRGELPIRIEIRKIPEYKVVLESKDAGKAEEFTELAPLQRCNDPFDLMALHKAALITCGLIEPESRKEETKHTLKDILCEIGGGIFLSTEVIGIPRGSGLGTSSILAGACMKGLFEFFGEEKSEDELYQAVLSMEQLMSTGGGWQDQVGGLTMGVKLITTKPGINQIIKVEKLDISESTLQELRERFVLIYTGQRRLARNLLRDVIGNYLEGRKESVHALEEMKKLAVLMKLELEQGSVDGFAALLNEHWELSKQLDSGSTNTCIEQIFLCCEDLIDGRFIAGAGGGGFLQVVLKRNVTKEQLRRRLYSVFQSSGVDVWECELV